MADAKQEDIMVICVVGILRGINMKLLNWTSMLVTYNLGSAASNRN